MTTTADLRAEAESLRARIAALEAMLDRIAEVPGVEFDPRAEECIADGVEALGDAWREASDDAEALRARLAEAESQAQASAVIAHAQIGLACDAADRGVVLRAQLAETAAEAAVLRSALEACLPSVRSERLWGESANAEAALDTTAGRDFLAAVRQAERALAAAHLSGRQHDARQSALAALRAAGVGP